MVADGGYVVQGYGWRYYLNTFCGILALLLRLSQPNVEVGLAYQAQHTQQMRLFNMVFLHPRGQEPRVICVIIHPEGYLYNTKLC